MEDHPETPLLSIVTPVRNDLDSLRACCASVRRLAGELPVEHIVMDGDSGDGTRDWLENAAGAGGRPCPGGMPALRWRSAPDNGMYEALNRGIALARAPFILHLNADEQALPGGPTRLVRYLEKHSGADLAFGDYLLAAADGSPLAARREIPLRRWYMRHGVNYILSCAAVFRREIWENLGPFDDTLKMLGDKDWYMRALDSGVRMAHVPGYVSLFVIRDANLSRSPDALQEQAEVRRRHRAYRSKSLRWIVRAARLLEKLARGACFPVRVSYFFFDSDERGKTVSGRAGAFWRWPARPEKTRKA